MRLPDFLIIGAMKSGTTTLYHDLGANPAIFMSDPKEPTDLTTDDVLTPEGMGRYAAIFERASSAQVCGEASTHSTKIPVYAGVPERARRLMGPHLRAIYLVREPISRAISHYKHIRASGKTHLPIDEAVRRIPDLVEFGRYAYQARPWLDTFGADRVRIVLFERYVGDRVGTVNAISEFLGVRPRPDLVRAEQVFNRSESKAVPRGPLAGIRNMAWYKGLVRPLVPTAMRGRVLGAVLPKAEPVLASPSVDTLRWMVDRLAVDAEELGRLLGMTQSPWDLGTAMKQALAGGSDDE